MNKKQKFIETGIKARLKNQGRSDRQVENNYNITKWTLISFIVLIGILLIIKSI
tara:strand:- start:1042 stop:1203 length:162 start_codon:yes stop_codon:yes gene_type:complete